MFLERSSGITVRTVRTVRKLLVITDTWNISLLFSNVLGGVQWRYGPYSSYSIQSVTLMQTGRKKTFMVRKLQKIPVLIIITLFTLQK